MNEPDALSRISYSINAEDVLLRRVFAGRTTGFFVDVGAEDPVNGNDFFALYEDGWRGINIEPNLDYFHRLQERRPLDQNLQVLVSDEASAALPFFIVDGTGLSTCDMEQAQLHATDGTPVHRVEMRATTLAQILGDARPPHIDVLKVDVEGFEEKVLRGNDWSRYRPSLIMLEATLPQSPVRRETTILEFLGRVGYQFAYHDGLNDFYIETNFKPPADAFRAPNVFDNVVRWDAVALRDSYDALHDRFNEVEHYARALEGERDSMSATLIVRERSERRLAASLDRTSRMAISLLAGDLEQADTLLADGGVAAAPEPAAGWQHETGRDLVVVAAQPDRLADQPDDRRDDELQLALVQARLISLGKENERLGELVRDLQFQNRRLTAGNAQLHGERLALHRALDEMRGQAQILTEARNALAAMQRLVHDETTVRDERAREVAARLERANAEAARIERVNEDAAEQAAQRNEQARLERVAERYGKRASASSADTLVLEAVYASTSWKLTRPVRVLGRLLRPRAP